jgi:hypothetical protein
MLGTLKGKLGHYRDIHIFDELVRRREEFQVGFPAKQYW